jgi:hypothetical protein
MNGIILAAGKASRFLGLHDYPKQLLIVEGETLLDRQVRMFRPHLDALYVVAHRKILARPQAKLFPPANCRWKCETLLSSTSLWSEKRTLAIHGDVYFTDQCRDSIIALEPDALTFFWDRHEVFAIVIPEQQYEEVTRALQRIVAVTASAERPAAQDNDAGFAALLAHFRDGSMPHQCVDVADRTQDFDMLEEYSAWRMGYTKNKLLSGQIVP